MAGINQEQIIEQLFETILSLQSVYARQMELLNESIARARAEYLLQLFEHKKSVLADCLQEIDQNIVECSLWIEEYERHRSALRDLSRKLTELTGEPMVMPALLSTERIEELIRLRLEYLKSLRKI